MATERRKMRHYRLALPVVLRLEVQEGMPAVTRDLSPSGAFLYTESRLQPGDAVEFTFELPAEVTLAGPLRIHCKAHVVRCEPAAGERTGPGVAVAIDAYKFNLPAQENSLEI